MARVEETVEVFTSVTVSVPVVRERRLSLAARGLFTFLSSYLPDDGSKILPAGIDYAAEAGLERDEYNELIDELWRALLVRKRGSRKPPIVDDTDFILLNWLPER